MRGSSQRSRDEVLRAFEPAASAASKKDALTLAQQLFAVVDTLDGSGSLRRALTDPARPGTDKATLVSSLFGSLDARVKDVVSDAVRARWSAEADLAETLEDAGTIALFAGAAADKSSEQVEEELFRVERALVASRDLLTALSDRSTEPSSRARLVEDVMGGKLHPVTQALVARRVVAPRGTRVLTAVRELVRLAAERRGRLLANVVAAVELSAAQRTRLSSILQSAYGREVQINVSVDPSVIGGIKIQVGSDVVDGTVLARLDDARRRLVG